MDKKFSFEDLLLYGNIGNIKIGSHKKELDNLFGEEEYGELHEAFYLKDASIQCYFDSNDRLEKFKVKFGVGCLATPFKNVFEIDDNVCKSEHYFSEFWEKHNLRFLTVKPYFYEGVKEEAAILSQKNVALIFNYQNLTHRLKKDRVLLDSVWVDGGFSWEYELDVLSGNSTSESRSEIRDKYYEGRPFR